jgi:hypothetical protein
VDWTGDRCSDRNLGREMDAADFVDVELEIDVV